MHRNKNAKVPFQPLIEKHSPGKQEAVPGHHDHQGRKFYSKNEMEAIFNQKSKSKL